MGHSWRTRAVKVETDVATRTPVAELDVGDDIVLNDAGPDVDAAARYSFADVQRRLALVILAVVFGMAVLALGRLRGLLALAGIGVTMGVLLAYVFPALLRGASPLGVALTGAIVIAVGTIYLAHGISDRTTVALVGTIASLLLTAALGASFGAAADLSGLASEESLSLLSFAPELDFRGLLLAATIIGALGVLNDVTITQVSAVWDLHTSDPQSGPSALPPRCLSPRPWPAGSSPSRAVSRSPPAWATAAPTRHATRRDDAFWGY